VTYASCVRKKMLLPWTNLQKYANDLQIVIVFWDKRKTKENQTNLTQKKVCYANEAYRNVK
jgi:hypothetical protein